MALADLPKAGLVGTSIASLLYGAYCILSPITIFVLVHRVKERRGQSFTDKVFLVGAILLFCILTAGWILDQITLWVTFVSDQDHAFAKLVSYNFMGERRGSERLMLFCLAIYTLDATLLYRLWVLYNDDRKVVILPVLTFIGSIVAGIETIVGSLEAPFGGDVWTLPVYRWMIAGFGLTLTTNVFAVGAITTRILYRNQAVRAIGSGTLMSVIIALVESAGLYCACNIAIMALLIAKSNYIVAALLASTPIAGISFCLITIRVGVSNWRLRMTNQFSGTPFSPAREPRQFSMSISRVVEIQRSTDGDVVNGWGSDQSTWVKDYPSDSPVAV